MYITFRMDDIAPDMDWNKFYKVKEVFDKYEIRPLVGIIPDNRDDNIKYSEPANNFWNVVRELKKSGWEIAQHGYQHLISEKGGGILNVNSYGEFSGLSYSEQLDKICKGRDVLIKNGINTTIFMAPAHSYDINTLKALKEANFEYVTDGYSLFPYYKDGLKFIPCQISQPKKMIIPGIMTVCIHSNNSTSKDLLNLEKFIMDNRKLIINYDEALDIKSRNLRGLISERLILLIRKCLQRIKKR